MDNNQRVTQGRLGMLRATATRQSLYGVGIAVSAIFAALLCSSWMQSGEISVRSILLAQESNPALWFLYAMPFVFSVLGQHMGHTVTANVTTIVSEHTRELREKAAELENRVAHDTTHDRLTGLPNYALLEDRVRQELLRAERTGESLALVALGVNSFKLINDGLGREAGDRLLQQIAERLRGAVRASDTLARSGGDEFAMLLLSTTQEDIEAVLHKILRTFDTPFVLGQDSVDVRASAGVSLSPRDGADFELLMQRADIAMDFAKQEKRDFCLYEQSMTRSTGSRSLRLLAHLRQAIRHGDLLLYFQPKVRAADLRPYGAEALVRLQHPEFGLVPPDEFIQLAEQHGLMQDLSRAVLRKAVEQAAAWAASGHELTVAVNLSTTTLLDEEFPNFVDELFATHAVPAGRVTLEVTESALLRDPEQALSILHRLAERGSGISIDDFGTGYSSLAYLSKMPATELKIDKSFVFEMLSGERQAAIVKGTIDLAHALGLRVVAEGVENERVVAALKALGCDQLQGYYFSRPLPPVQFDAWFAAQAAAGGPERAPS